MKSLIICPGLSLNNFDKAKLSNYDYLIGVNRGCNYTTVDYASIGNPFNVLKVDWTKYKVPPALIMLRHAWYELVDDWLGPDHNRVWICTEEFELYGMKHTKSFMSSLIMAVLFSLNNESKNVDIIGCDFDHTSQEDFDGYISRINKLDRNEKSFTKFKNRLNIINANTDSIIRRI